MPDSSAFRGVCQQLPRFAGSDALCGSVSVKIQYPPDMRLSCHPVSIEVPQREGDGRQALVPPLFIQRLPPP